MINSPTPCYQTENAVRSCYSNLLLKRKGPTGTALGPLAVPLKILGRQGFETNRYRGPAYFQKTLMCVRVRVYVRVVNASGTGGTPVPLLSFL